jgi:hypothetical protein
LPPRIRTDSPTVRTPTRPKRTDGPKPKTPNTPKPTPTPVRDGFDFSRAAIGAKGLSFEGKSGSAALVAIARSIEAGGAPFSKASAADLSKAIGQLAAELAKAPSGKDSKAALLSRSAAATALLSLAGEAKGEARTAAQNAYAAAMGKETSRGLRLSMLTNLDASKLGVSGPAKAAADKVRAELLPGRPPYEEWFKGSRHTLEVRHYVMEDFFKASVAAYRKRGFSVMQESSGKVVLKKPLLDPAGKNKPLEARVTLVKGEENIFRDMKDPSVQMVVYSGHAQLGGVVTSSLDQAKGAMAGTKLVQLYQCRGKQTVGEVASRYPGVHATATFSSSYDEDDNTVLTRTFEMIAARKGYGELKTDLKDEGLLQTAENYILPNDPRMLASRDEDQDGLRDLTKVGADKFFDPGAGHAEGGRSDFKPRLVDGDPATFSGEKLGHAVSYANTAFYYFSEENRASPISHAASDKFVPGGWFESKGDEPLRLVKTTKGGESWYRVDVNAKYADQSREAIAAMTLYELQKALCLEKNGKFTEADKLRGLQQVEGYCSVMVPYREECDALMQSFAKAYGFKGVSWEVVEAAAFKDGHDGNATPEALDYLRKHGVTAPG